MLLTSRLRRPLGAAVRKTSLTIDGEELPVILRRNRQARRFILRLDKTGTGIVVTVPEFANNSQAMEFAAAQAGWIQSQRRKQTPARTFSDGQSFPLRGLDHTISHRPDGRGTVWIDECDGPQLCIAGRPEHLPRRLKDWLKKQARLDLESASRKYGAAMGLEFSRITVRDQSSRWGSCSSNGTLSYSWRLILAPEFVLDYVAAHEVAHLREMNHGQRFWTLVETHCQDSDAARSWLKKNGRQLHRYGA